MTEKNIWQPRNLGFSTIDKKPVYVRMSLVGAL